ncbi:MAG: Gfo/Idh/MocA family oxidoreductase [Elusimicrobiales bacterium]|nr:Gfo/Idh/MocA family oxidoreductase [Elusimicrobiales bacterium]
MLKGAFIGGPGAFGFSPSSFAGGDFRITAFAAPGARRERPAFPREAQEYPTIKSLIAAELQLDFAAISLPPGETFGALLPALERGLHVICSAPPCLSTTEFETLRGAAEKAGKVIFIVQPWEHAAPWLALSKALTRGLAGEINYAEVQALLPGPEPEGGAVAALGWQAASMLLAMVRRPPSAIEARLDSGAAAACHVHFGGADGFLHLACGAHAPRLRAAVAGDKGRIELDGNLLRLDIKDMAPETVELRHELVPGVCLPEWLAAELSDFKKEIEGSRERGSGLRNSRYCVKLLRNASYSASVKSAAIPL